MLVLTLFVRWERDAVFVLVRAFVDESGTGGEGRIMLAALVAKAHQWHGFHKGWRALLKKHEIDYSHLVDMENGRAPFGDWDKARCWPFIQGADKLIQKYCDFGYTSAISIHDYRAHYRHLLPTQHKDSAYGACARTLIEEVALFARAAWGQRTVVNFIFENNQHFEDARRIFTDLKAHVPDLAQHLGQIALGEKRDYGALQAADVVVALSRREETRAVFKDITDRRNARTRRKDGRIRIFHGNLTPEVLTGHVRQAHQIHSEKRWEAKKRRRAKKTGNS